MWRHIFQPLSESCIKVNNFHTMQQEIRQLLEAEVFLFPAHHIIYNNYTEGNSFFNPIAAT